MPYQSLYHELVRGGQDDGQPMQYQARDVWWRVFCACIATRPLIASIRLADAAMRHTGLHEQEGVWVLRCNGDHAAPECGDAQCWRKEPAPFDERTSSSYWQWRAYWHWFYRGFWECAFKRAWNPPADQHSTQAYQDGWDEVCNAMIA